MSTRISSACIFAAVEGIDYDGKAWYCSIWEYTEIRLQKLLNFQETARSSPPPQKREMNIK
jgi:hypothetical protein